MIHKTKQYLCALLITLFAVPLNAMDNNHSNEHDQLIKKLDNNSCNYVTADRLQHNLNILSTIIESCNFEKSDQEIPIILQKLQNLQSRAEYDENKFYKNYRCNQTIAGLSATFWFCVNAGLILCFPKAASPGLPVIWLTAPGLIFSCHDLKDNWQKVHGELSERKKQFFDAKLKIEQQLRSKL